MIGDVTDNNGWRKLIEADPGHSQWYIDRFRSMAEAGTDLAGEARLVDAMLARGSRVLDAGCGTGRVTAALLERLPHGEVLVLDAGCGTGRVGSFLAAAGHDVTGVDLDPALIAEARRTHPTSRWLVGDLAELDLPAQGIAEGFDAIVCAGNVMTFLAPETRRTVLERLRAHVRAEGRVVIGFGAGRGYGFDEFRVDAEAAGLTPDLLLSTWDLRPFHPGASFIVAVLTA
jgi:SAM-dependent methyltransferase